MSTRAQIIVQDPDKEEIWFYRHSDGYPKGVKKTLDQFCAWVRTGLIRNNTQQAAGWLVILGHAEYDDVWENGDIRKKRPDEHLRPSKEMCSGWKVGAYEPCEPVIHSDVEHMYRVVLGTNRQKKPTAQWFEVGFNATINRADRGRIAKT